MNLNLQYAINNGDIYNDGNVEDELLEIYESIDSVDKIKNILNNKPSWPLRYHLSSVRENLLNWYDFDKSASILEIGAGCGALTSMFCEKVKNVTAIELSQRRAKIISARCREVNNLEIYAGNLNDINLKQKFDYITLIGVLEYAGKYTHTNNPFVDFLKSIKKNLKINGTLIIAIENKFGLKYWSGCREDHTGNFFESIEGYPHQKEIQTFGKEEISFIVKESGFSELEFYYPVPDYKMPIEIFSDKYLPTQSHFIKSGLIPTKDYAQEREYLFREDFVMKEIVKNKKFDFFANSFLIFAKL